MIELSEQYGYKNPKAVDGIDHLTALLGKKHYAKTIQKGTDPAYCYKVVYNEHDEKPYCFETSYFVGIDWIEENKVSIFIKPKLDEQAVEVNYLKMLFAALQEPENFKHLDQLCEIDFDKKYIKVPQSQDMLTPLLIIQFLNILRQIVRKGLKKSYYNITRNLNSRIKGRILITDTLVKNHFNSKILYSYCIYSEYGVNSIENKVLKKALAFCSAAIQNLKGINTEAINTLIRYVQPAFHNVDDEVNVDDLKTVRSNSFFKEYSVALKMAKQILKRFGYNITNATSALVNTPPFWIDMSKLFELYVFAKLKEKFPLHGEVEYHKKFNYLEPDFIIKSHDEQSKMIVDAKYKPQYQDGKVTVEDIRQISGYARLKRIYDYLDIEDNELIDCLVVYSHQAAGRKDFLSNFVLVPEPEYVRFYKIGIELPEKTLQNE